mmetsp:Transcript_19146/g.51198  ORF Transcript_19146/g.51198 Transcript_19146/m.51198 type:complete len:210 (+) Transcript_19146:1256-1885(+)
MRLLVLLRSQPLGRRPTHAKQHRREEGVPGELLRPWSCATPLKFHGGLILDLPTTVWRKVIIFVVRRGRRHPRRERRHILFSNDGQTRLTHGLVDVTMGVLQLELCHLDVPCEALGEQRLALGHPLLLVVWHGVALVLLVLILKISQELSLEFLLILLPLGGSPRWKSRRCNWTRVGVWDRRRLYLHPLLHRKGMPPRQRMPEIVFSHA